MDVYSLTIITYGRSDLRPVRVNASAEDRYYSNHAGMRWVRPGLLGSVALAAGMVMMLGITLI